jgi:hypothetical protein
VITSGDLANDSNRLKVVVKIFDYSMSGMRKEEIAMGAV